MPRLRWIKGTDKWVNLDEITPKVKSERINVISDSTDSFLSHADGKMYESKSEYRKSLKKLGYIEVGNENVGKSMTESFKERFAIEAKKTRTEDIAKAWNKAVYKN